MHKRLLRIVLGLMVAGYIGFCLAVYFFPRYFFYNPTTEHSDLSQAVLSGFNAKEVEYLSADNTKLYGWFVKPQPGHKIIVYFHGNSYNIAAFYHKLIPFVSAGYGVFIGEYRGFGGIEGTINEANIAADSQAAIDYLNSLGYHNSSLIIYGMSLGSFSAVNTAYTKGLQDSFAALILEVPFDSLINVVKQRIWPLFPFDLIIKDDYDNVSKIKQLHLPVLIMGAAEDKVVPLPRAKALYEAANDPKKMIVYPQAGHSELYHHDNYIDILNWLKDNEKTK